MKKIGFVGAGMIGKSVLVHASKDEMQEPSYPVYEEELFPANHYPKVYDIRTFCKGRHTYTEVRTREDEGDGGVFIRVEWICKCGKKL